MRTQRLASSSDPVSEYDSTKDHNRHRTSRGADFSTHRSVLLHEVLEALAIREGDTIVDCTLGGGGHACELVRLLGPQGFFIGIDADRRAVERAKNALAKEHVAARIELRETNFRKLSNVLNELEIQKIDKVLLDLGWSGYQLEGERGFSLRVDEPLLMTYGDPKQAICTAFDVVNSWSEEHIADIIHGFGEERYARRVARAIVAAREKGRIERSMQLADIISQSVPVGYRHGRLHPATRTFQAIRMAVNDEVGALSEALLASREHLAEGGRVAVISFHSIEDRIVKRTFAAWKGEGFGMPVTKKPITASEEEVARNPRSRSAKLRVFERNTT